MLSFVSSMRLCTTAMLTCRYLDELGTGDKDSASSHTDVDDLDLDEYVQAVRDSPTHQ